MSSCSGSDEDTPQEEYSYAYKGGDSTAEDDIYYITDDELLDIRSKVKPRRNKSIKGSRSMEQLTS